MEVLRSADSRNVAKIHRPIPINPPMSGTMCCSGLSARRRADPRYEYQIIVHTRTIRIDSCL